MFIITFSIILFFGSSVFSLQLASMDNGGKCIATDGTEYNIGDVWTPETTLEISCIACTCLPGNIVKCKKTICSETSVSQKYETNFQDLNPVSEYTKEESVHLTEDFEKSSFDADVSEKYQPSWRQRLSEFYDNGGVSLPKISKVVDKSKSSFTRPFPLKSDEVDNPYQTFDNQQGINLRRKQEIQRRLQVAMGAKSHRQSRLSSSRHQFRDTSHIFNLLKADSSGPKLQSPLKSTLSECRVQILPGRSGTTQTYAHGDWWKASLPILGQSKCVECTCSNGEVKCKVPKCVAPGLLSCKNPQTEAGKCCASCPIRINNPNIYSKVDYPTKQQPEYKEEIAEKQKSTKCGTKFHPLLYRFVPTEGEDENKHGIAVRMRDSVDTYTWILSEDDKPHRRHVIRMRASNFRRYAQMSTIGGTYQLWSATSEDRLRKFKSREEKWNSSCHSQCEKRLRRMVSKMLLKSPRRVKCALANIEEDAI